ncbi:MAG: hypothetical protein K2X93_24190 [Candidatus Obscuribacterales bacterium]|nr:hypothetical protein [Candidatus Obscuribacterales bacterium]
MNKFGKIVCVDKINLTPDAYDRIAQHSMQGFAPCTADDPVDSDDTYSRIGDADAALVSWRSKIGADVLKRCTELRYMGLCASKYTNPKEGNIDLEAAKALGIAVSAVGQYGDEATAEYIFCKLLEIARGFEKAQWKEMPCELFEKTIGIVGMGSMGSHVLRLARGFGMNVIYASRTPKPECGAKMVELDELLATCDIVSLHVPKGFRILGKKEFAQMRPGAMLVNTCLGVVFEPEDFSDWSSNPRNLTIMDESCDPIYRQFRTFPNVIYPAVVAGRTEESRARLSEQVISNMVAYLNGTPKNLMTSR